MSAYMVLVGTSEGEDFEEDLDVILIIGVCILSCVYQLNIRITPYATNVSACFIVHSQF
jgi:hypothetical protein